MTTPEPKPLTPAELKLLNWAFEQLSQLFSCAGCNDFDLQRDGGLGEEWLEIARGINSRRQACDQVGAESLRSSSFMDFEVAGYLRDRINGKV